MKHERIVAACWLVTTAAAVGLAVVYWSGGQTQLEGLLLAIAFGSLSAGFVVLAHRLLPPGPVTEARHVLDSPPEVDHALDVDLDRGGLTRRRLLTRTFGLALGALAVAAAFPIRSP